jgi:hypothetical protein
MKTTKQKPIKNQTNDFERIVLSACPEQFGITFNIIARRPEFETHSDKFASAMLNTGVCKYQSKGYCLDSEWLQYVNLTFTNVTDPEAFILAAVDASIESGAQLNFVVRVGSDTRGPKA